MPYLLREARLTARITQQALADRSGIGQPAIARLERGDRLPRLDTAAALARALGVSIDSMWAEDATDNEKAPAARERSGATTHGGTP